MATGKHEGEVSSSPSKINIRNSAIGAAVILAVLIVVFIATAGSRTSSSSHHAAAVQKIPTLSELLQVKPASSAPVPINTPIVVKSAPASIVSVKVTSSNGSQVSGSINSASDIWSTNDLLDPSTTYTIDATIASGKKTYSSTNTVTTQSIGKTVFGSADLPESYESIPVNDTVGVGFPITIHFTRAITSPQAQAAVLSHIQVFESDVVPGGFKWFSPTELHYRPEEFWPTGEHVEVEADLNGWNVGNGLWGSGTFSASFNVGATHISIANLATDEMTVTSDGKVVYTMPISGGRPIYQTMTGIHIAMNKAPVVHMVSSTVGIPVNSPNGYNEMVYNDVHISDSGEYVHAAPWSVADQGITNVSHGCINVSTANSLLFYNFTQIGDVVEVVDGSRLPLLGDHGLMDWSTDWSTWTPAPAVSLSELPLNQKVVEPTTTTTTTIATTTTSVS